MLPRFRRRHCRNRLFIVLTSISFFSLLSFIIPSDSVVTPLVPRTDDNPHLYCILLLTNPIDDKYIHASNITWGKNCYKTAIVRYTTSKTSYNDYHGSGSSYYVNLWTRILIAIRRSVHFFEHISNNDILVIVPAATFVFREKLPLLFRTSSNHSQLPLIIIYEQEEENAYIFNGRALHLVRNTKLIDSCLKTSYPSVRETYLWKCIKHTLSDWHQTSNCNDCFIYNYRNQLTLSYIKNGFCLNKNLSLCRSMPLVYPATVNDMITLEFFKYRLKPWSHHPAL